MPRGADQAYQTPMWFSLKPHDSSVDLIAPSLDSHGYVDQSYSFFPEMGINVRFQRSIILRTTDLAPLFGSKSNLPGAFSYMIILYWHLTIHELLLCFLSGLYKFLGCKWCILTSTYQYSPLLPTYYSSLHRIDHLDTTSYLYVIYPKLLCDIEFLYLSLLFKWDTEVQSSQLRLWTY